MSNVQRLVFCVPTNEKRLIMARSRWKADGTTDEYVCFSRTFKKRVEFYIFPAVFVIICQLEGGLEGESLREKGGFARESHSC